MKRAIDKPYFTYSAYSAYTSSIRVKCPKCGEMGIVTSDNMNSTFKCTNCGDSKSKERTLYRYDVHNQCKECGRSYRIDIDDESKQHFPTLYVQCPHCGYPMSGKIHKTTRNYLSYTGEIKDGHEPYFGFELWFLTSFRSKTIWAINREHLAYMIEYLRADLREKSNEDMSMKSQADHLPTFMKTAKNRDEIVKKLKELQNK